MLCLIKLIFFLKNSHIYLEKIKCINSLLFCSILHLNFRSYYKSNVPKFSFIGHRGCKRRWARGSMLWQAAQLVKSKKMGLQEAWPVGTSQELSGSKLQHRRGAAVGQEGWGSCTCGDRVGQCLKGGPSCTEPCWGCARRAAAHGKPRRSVQEEWDCGNRAESDHGGAAEMKHYGLTTAPIPHYPELCDRKR